MVGFPNLFTITGPGSPSVLSNMLVSIEQHVDWTVDCIGTCANTAHRRIEPIRPRGADGSTTSTKSRTARCFREGGSWYLGANIPGKPRVFMPYCGGRRRLPRNLRSRCCERLRRIPFATSARGSPRLGKAPSGWPR